MTSPVCFSWNSSFPSRIVCLRTQIRRPRCTCDSVPPPVSASSVLSAKERARIIVLPGMDGTDLLLDGFRKALGGDERGDDPERIIAVEYPYDQHLRMQDELCRYVTTKYLQKLEDDTRGYIIVAQSFSGHVALKLCNRNGSYSPLPGRYLGCVLVNGFCSAPGPAWAHRLRSALSLALRYQPPAWMVSNIFLGKHGNTNGEMDIVQQAGARVEQSVMQARLGECLDMNTWAEWRDRDGLQGSTVLYLQGLGDVIVQATSMAEKMKLAREDIEFVGIEHGPHLLLQRFPEPCARAIDDFARKRVAGS